jgi:hypothetical protein
MVRAKRTILGIPEHRYLRRTGTSQLTMRLRFAPAVERAKVQAMGIIEAGNSTLDRLEEHLGKMEGKMMEGTGVFHYSLHSPNGQEMWGKFVYHETGRA